MSSAGAFPGSHTTATTATIKITPLIWFDSAYVQTRPGFLKAAIVVINLIAFICASVGWCGSCGSVTFFNLVAMFGFWVSIILLALYLFHVIEKMPNVPWILAEFVYCSLWTVLYFLASLLIITNGGMYAAAGFFGFGATAIYGADAFFKYQAYQAGEVAQGERASGQVDDPS
jgi:hypothetical protein